MTIELKNDYLTVQFQEVGGALSSIKDKDGVEYLWQGMQLIGVAKRQSYSRIAEVFVTIRPYLVKKWVSFQDMDWSVKKHSRLIL